VSTLWTLYGVLLTVAAYALSRALTGRYPSPFTTPVFFSTALIVLVLVASGTPFSDSQQAKDLMVTLLGPATVALAVPIYKSRHVLAANALPALGGIVAGAASTVLVALSLGTMLMLEPVVLLSMTVKSVTAPVAVELAGIIHGNLTLAAAFVIATGMIGTMLGPWLMDRAGIHHPLARGLALGTISHGQGTAQAVSEGEKQGAIAGIAMGVSAVLTSVALPSLLRQIL
jgi:putative effector of murein hydrolase